MLDTDIKTYNAAEVSKLASNGGRCSDTQVISGVINNVWPHVPKAERTAGAFLYRKLFTAAEDDTDGTMIASLQLIDRPTLGEDYISAFVGTATDTQGDITGAMTGTDTERKYGAAYIKNSITAGGSTITVTVEHIKFASGNDALFQAGDKIQLKSLPTPDSATGTSEDLTIDTIDAVDVLDVTFTVAESIANDYTANDGHSRCVSMIDYGDIQCSTDNYVVTTAGDGDYDYTNNPLTTDNIGTVEDSLTIEFTDDTSFTVIGSSGIDYGAGSKGVDFSPTNAAKTKPYFTLLAAGFSGLWAAADSITVDIHHAKYATWYRREVPAGCASLANNKLTTVTAAESAS